MVYGHRNREKYREQVPSPVEEGESERVEMTSFSATNVMKSPEGKHVPPPHLTLTSVCAGRDGTYETHRTGPVCRSREGDAPRQGQGL